MNTHRSRLQTAIRALIFVIAWLTLAGGVRAASWKEKVLYSFQGLPDGATPSGGVVFDQAGNLYGATIDGGANTCPGITECGTVYQLKPPVQKGKPWTESVLYVFKGADFNDGTSATGGLIFDQAGNLYGTTSYGGSGGCQLFGTRVGCGTVYELIPPKQKIGVWTEKVLYSFKSGKDGYFPQGDLIFDAKGNLYGATQYGGGFGSCNAPFYQYCGTVFELSPPKTKGGKWTEKVLYAFKSGKDGANPNGGLVFDRNGNIYGTTFYGGDTTCKANAGVGCGTAFELKCPTRIGDKWMQKQLHSFVKYGTDGAGPNGGLVFDSKGRLYGTTTGGGSTQNGVVFQLAKSGSKWTETVLRTFVDGRDSRAGLIFDPLGRLYGTTTGGGFDGIGTVFKLKEPGTGRGQWRLDLLHTFTGPPDGDFPTAPLVLSEAGALYGSTQNGGTGQSCQGGCGVVFEVSP